MKVSSIQNINVVKQNVKYNKYSSVQDGQNQEGQATFRGDAGKVIGGILGFAAAATLVVATGGIAGVAAPVLGYLGIKKGAEAGDKIEDESKKKPEEPKKTHRP